MSKTIVIQIGNSDDKLSQRAWSNFVNYVHAEFDHRSPAVEFHFFGFSPPDAYWQNCCMVFNVDHEALGYEDFETYLNDLRFILSNAAQRYKQDSIALLVGETEFVPFNYQTKEILSAHSNEDDHQEGAGQEVDDFDGYASKEDQLAAYSEEDALDPLRQEDDGIRPV